MGSLRPPTDHNGWPGHTPVSFPATHFSRPTRPWDISHARAVPPAYPAMPRGREYRKGLFPPHRHFVPRTEGGCPTYWSSDRDRPGLQDDVEEIPPAPPSGGKRPQRIFRRVPSRWEKSRPVRQPCPRRCSHRTQRQDVVRPRPAAVSDLMPRPKTRPVTDRACRAVRSR